MLVPVVVVQGGSNFQWMGLVPVLECGEGADVMPRDGLRVGIECGGDDASNGKLSSNKPVDWPVRPNAELMRSASRVDAEA